MDHPRQDGPAGRWPVAGGRGVSHRLVAVGGERPWVMDSC